MQNRKKEFSLLLRSVPSYIVAFFVLSVVMMNLLANKTIYQSEYLALDGGILISWLSFMCMDVITKHFGPRAASEISLFAVLCNLLACLIFYLAAIIPSNAQDYSAFNSIFALNWFILLGSTIAFIASSLVNNVLNHYIGSCFKKNPDGKLAFMTRSYLSTLAGQFVDNLFFAIIVFMIFAPIFWQGFSWTFIQCVTCALTGAVLELIMEMIFSPWAYRITKSWQKDKVGEAYLSYMKEKR